MKWISIIWSIFLLFGCSSNSNNENISSIDSISRINTNQLMDKALSESPTAFINALSKNCPLISSLNFELTAESDDSIEKKLLPLSKQQKEYFYKSDSLKEVHDFYHFESFYYGKINEKEGISSIFVLNSNFETAIYLECFLINKKGEITGMFYPSYIELEENYSYYGRGKFINDFNYLQTHISYTNSDDETYTVKDSTIAEYNLSKSGIIYRKVVYSESDTIKIE